MRFAFLIHPISAESAALMDLDHGGMLQELWGVDPLGLCARLHEAVAAARMSQAAGKPLQSRVADELRGLASPLGKVAEGRLYEIPMDAAAILADPDQALGFIEQAAEMAVEWGARVIGLGSMTGIIGGRGTHLAERCPVAVTTGNSLTVYSALQNLYHVIEEWDIDLSRETVAVVGVPGSIASAVAALISSQCGELLLVGRQASTPAKKLAEHLGAELLLDVPQALARARVIISATSTGSCIDQRLLQPGSVVIDVGVPTDVQGAKAIRDDVMILTGGLVSLPPTMPLESKFLWFQHGVIPSCLGETMLLALEDREECLSLGRTLDLDSIQEIGAIAKSHGFDFLKFYSFGHPLDESPLVRFHKVRHRQRYGRRPASVATSSPACEPQDQGRTSRAACRHEDAPPTPQELAERAGQLHARHINPVLIAASRTSDFVKTFVRGEGAYLYDAEGNQYLDFVAGFGSVNMGHNHPAIVEAVNDALRRQAPGFAQSAVNPYAAALAGELAAIAPHNLEMVFFTNSGTEAIEAALKLARASTGRTGILFCDRSYHGKSLGALSITGNQEYRRPFGPLLPDCEGIPYGDYAALERTLSTRKFAAFVIEPIQAEGGMIVPPSGYLREVQALCRSTGTLLVADEIQTGLGRTGTLFAVDREGVDPDVMTLAKSLGGGLVPIGAMLARRDLWLQAYGTVQTFALHTSTFGGGSLACAAGLAALRVLRDENLPANAEARGAQLFRGLADICARCDCVREVRGRGLLLGLEFHPLPANVNAHWKGIDRSGMTSYMVPGLDRLVDGIPAMHAMQTLLHAHRIYTQVARSNPLVLRVEPPLTITEEQADRFLRALDQTCQDFDYSTNLIDGMIAKTGIGQHNATRRHAPEVTEGVPEPRLQG